jgi:hypothetical protein
VARPNLTVVATSAHRARSWQSPPQVPRTACFRCPGAAFARGGSEDPPSVAVALKGGAMSFYIIDNAGKFVHMERVGGRVCNDIRTALLKAQTTLRTRQPTSHPCGTAQERIGTACRVLPPFLISSRSRAASRP